MTFPLMPWPNFGENGKLYIKGTSPGIIEVGDIIVLYQFGGGSGRVQGFYLTPGLTTTTSYTTMASDSVSAQTGESPGGYVSYIYLKFAVRIKVAELADVGLTQPNTTNLFVIGSTNPSQTLGRQSQAAGSVDFSAAAGPPIGLVYAGIRANGADIPTIPGDGTVTNQAADVSYARSKTAGPSGNLSGISGATKINIFHNGEEGTIAGTETIANGTGTDSRSWQLIYGVD